MSMMRIRARVQRELSQHAEDESSTGELNLIPYLDIVVNTVIFLLTTMASSFAFATIEAQGPSYVDPRSIVPPQKTGELDLFVSISYQGFLVGSTDGILSAADGTFPTIPCARPLIHGRCAADAYNLQALKKTIKQIKARFPAARRVTLTADAFVSYDMVVATMDTLRGKPTGRCTGRDGCFFDQVVFSQK